MVSYSVLLWLSKQIRNNLLGLCCRMKENLSSKELNKLLALTKFSKRS